MTQNRDKATSGGCDDGVAITSGTNGSLIVALCSCCAEHGPDPERPAGGMTWTVVTCPECGQKCSCEGCVADVEDCGL